MADQVNNNNTSRKYSTLILYLVVIVLINLVGITLYWRLDLTANGLYSLSAASKKVVSNLSEPLTVHVFFSKNLPPPYNNIELYLHDLLEEYELHSNNNLSYRFYDVTSQEEDLSKETEENRKIALGYGITPISIRKIEKDEVRVRQAFMGMALIYGDVAGKIPAITSTSDLEYRITNAIRGMTDKITALGNLTGKIRVTLVLSSSILQVAPDINLQGVEILEAGVQDAVDRLNRKTFNRLEFMYIDPDLGQGDPGQLLRFQRFSLEWPEFKTANGMVVPAGTGMAAIGVSYGQKSVERNLLNRKIVRTSRGPAEQYSVIDMDQVETFIDDNINNIIDINEELGYLDSHGAVPLLDLPSKYPPPPDWKKGEELKRFNNLVSQSYSLKEITLEEPVPDGIDTLIIAGVKRKFTDWQLFLIDQFLMKGKSLALFLDAFNEIRPPGGDRYQPSEYHPLDTGLEKLLAHYGLKVKKSYLLDENCFINRERIELPIYYAPIIKDENINHSQDFMKNIKRLLVVKASPLEADKEKIEKNNLVLEPLFFSSEKSWEMSGRIDLTPQNIRPPADPAQKESKPLAYLLEGEFPSYFADKPIPAKPVRDEIKDTDNDNNDKVSQPAVSVEKNILAKGKPGKIFLIGTSYILKNSLLDEEGRSTNAVFLLNLLDYLNNREDIAVMRSKNQLFNPLKDTGAFVKLFVKILNIAGLPILVILLGLITWFRRMAWKKRIRAMFDKT